MASGDTKTEALLNILGNGGDASAYSGCCNTKTQGYILDAINRVQNVEDEVEELKNNPDVVDIVDTYADLQAYDTQHLTDNDIIRVLQDETHSGNSTYYRFTKDPDTWTFIGEVSGGVNVVQTTGESTTDVMSQNATTRLVYDDPTAKRKIKIGQDASTDGNNTVAIGYYAYTKRDGNVAIGSNASAHGNNATVIGSDSSASGNGAVVIGKSAYVQSDQLGSVALGSYSRTSSTGEVNIGPSLTSYGYNNTNYRLLTGLYDGQSAHDAATLAQGNTLATSAPTTATVGVLGQLYTDTTTMHTYQCTAISGSDYTWTQRW